MIWLMIPIALWLICSALAYGSTMATFWPLVKHLESRWWCRRYALEIGVQGPIGLLICAFREERFSKGFLWW